MYPGFPEIVLHRSGPTAIFAALSDDTRLSLIARLCRGQDCSITELTEGTNLTRQAVTKHLRVLEEAGLVHSVRQGRETRFAFDPAPIDEARDYLDRVSQEWDRALFRLKSLVEEGAKEAVTTDEKSQAG